MSDARRGDPAHYAAKKRLDTFLRAIERMSIDDLLMIALPLPDPASRSRIMAAATDAAAASGREALLTDAREHARRLLVDGFARRAYEPTWFGLNWSRSLGRPGDRAALFAAAEDAAAGVVVEDLIDPGLFDDLAGRFQSVAGMKGSAPAVNPVSVRSRTGVAGRVALVVVIVLTFAWGVAGELLILLTRALERPRDIIDLF